MNWASLSGVNNNSESCSAVSLTLWKYVQYYVIAIQEYCQCNNFTPLKLLVKILLSISHVSTCSTNVQPQICYSLRNYAMLSQSIWIELAKFATAALGKNFKKGGNGHKAGKSMQFLTICTVKFARSTFNASQHFRNSESINALTRFSLIVFYFIALLVSLLLKMPTVFSNFTYYDHFRHSQLHKGSGYMHKVTTV